MSILREAQASTRLDGETRVLRPIMRCLSLKEPWLYLMTRLPEQYRKNVENRTRNITNTMGPTLLHASKGMSRSYYDSVRDAVLGRKLVPEKLFPRFESFEGELGGIKGAFEITRHIGPNNPSGLSYRWKFPGHHGYDTRNAIALPFRPYSGALGFFRVELTADEEIALRKAGLLP